MIERQIDSPMPIPSAFVVKNVSNTWLIFSGAMPIPESRTAMRSWSGSCIRDRISSSRGRSMTVAIAWIALTTRLINTCCSWT